MLPHTHVILWLFDLLLAGMLMTLGVGYVLGRRQAWAHGWIGVGLGCMALAFLAHIFERLLQIATFPISAWMSSPGAAHVLVSAGAFLPVVGFLLIQLGLRVAQGRTVALLVIGVGSVLMLWGIHLEHPGPGVVHGLGILATISWIREARTPGFPLPRLWYTLAGGMFGITQVGELLIALNRWDFPGVLPLGYLLFLTAFGFAYEAFQRASIMSVFFVRLNLLFILLAIVTMLLTERGLRVQFLNLTHRQVWDFVELVRGLVVSHLLRETETPTILDDPRIFEEVVKSFSRYPNLYAFHLQVDGHARVFTIDAIGNVSLIDRAGYPLPAIPVEGAVELRGDHLAVRVPIVHRNAVVGHMQLNMQAQPMLQYMFRILFPLYVAFTVAVIGGGLLIGALVLRAQRTIEHQIREIQRMNLEMMQTARMATLGEIATSIAHDLATPLGSVLLGLEEAEENLNRLNPDLPAVRKDLALLKGQVMRASRFIQHLLEISRARPIERRPVGLADVVRRVLELVQSRLMRHQIRVHLQGFQRIPTLWASGVELEELLLNIVNNAIDAMPQGGELRIQAEYNPTMGRIVLRISDTGHGIESTQIPRVFEPFYTTKPRGTGLGLAISRRIVHAHGGEIRIESQPGEGTTVTVELPVLPPEPLPESQT